MKYSKQARQACRWEVLGLGRVQGAPALGPGCGCGGKSSSSGIPMAHGPFGLRCAASVHRREKKRGIAHQSLFSRACLRGRTDWLPTPDGGRCLKFTVLSAGQASRTLWPLCCRTWSRHQVPLNASLEHGKLKQRCSSQSQPEWVYAAFIWQDSYTARVRESVADGRATLQSLWRTCISTRRRA